MTLKDFLILVLAIVIGSILAGFGWYFVACCTVLASWVVVFPFFQRR